MGADGHILIWRRERVKAAWPDCEELFRNIDTHYLDVLDGVEYDHVYWGDNLMNCWWEHYETDPAKKERLDAFCKWLQYESNPTHWEVWT